jgi:hypothetical protein
MAPDICVSRPFLTVLTKPMASERARAYAGLRRAARAIVKPNAPLPEPSPYPGHHGLVRSVVEGLRSIDADFNFNPESFADLAETVYAPANEALLQAASLKQEGTIKTLVGGPTNALLPQEANGILLTPEVDVLIVASDWVRDLTASAAPEIAHKLRVCHAGIDAEFWKPTSAMRAQRAVVYWKDSPEALCIDAERVLRAAALEPVRLRYGGYDAVTFKTALEEARLAVFLSTFETQGLALAEAWAMDVPTLVWDPQAETEWAGIPFKAASSAPYLTRATGVTWKALSELETCVCEALTVPQHFSTRQWVLAHMTDAIGAANLYEIIRRYNNAR